jgi:polyhydroxyalkanoate synthase
VNNELPAEPDQWFAATTQNEGSWWPEWEKWLAGYSGENVPARQPEGHEDAPGSYVRVMAN